MIDDALVTGLNVQEIESLLCRYLPRELAAQRAVWLSEDLAMINFGLELAHETPDSQWIAMGIEPQVEYRLPDPGYSINSEDDNSALSGSFITVGNLLRLSQVSAIGRRLIPQLWPLDFDYRLCGREHLNALNEVWWLKHWRGISTVQRGPKLNKAAPDYEWAITIRDTFAECRVNLEIKRRPGNINGWFKRRRPTARLNEVAKKFGPVADDTANVVALTVYLPLSEEIKRGVLDWFESCPNVHGILIWIEGNLGIEPMIKLFKPDRAWAQHLILEPDSEDLAVAAHCAGTLCSKEDVSAYLKAICEGVPWHKHVN